MPDRVDHKFLADLRLQLEGIPVSDMTEGGPTPWNGAIAATTLARLACKNAEEVQRAVRATKDLGLPISVLAGGHDPWGRAFEPDRVLLDLGPMSHARHDSDAGSVTVGGGATAAHLLAALPRDVATVTGTIGTIGMVGLTTGGGYGKLTARYGLASDVLLGAEVVLADGSAVRANETENPDLFWALRGGGTGFGVVTEITFATFALAEVGRAALRFPLAFAKPAMLACQEAIHLHPDRFSAVIAFAAGPDGRPALNLSLLWTGDKSLGTEVLDGMARLPASEVLAMDRVPYAATLEPAELWPWGRRYCSGTVTVGALERDVIDALIVMAEAMPTPGCVLFLQDFHGAPTRIAPDATAFPLRRDHFIVGIVSGWDAGAEHDAPACRTWTQDAERHLQAWSLPGGYVNFLSPDQGDLAELFYGRSAERIRRIRSHYDPSGTFDRSTGSFRR